MSEYLGVRTQVILMLWFLFKYCYVFTFYKRLNMSSLIANQLKPNMCFVSVKIFIVLTTFVPLFTLNWYNNNYNNKCLSDTTIRNYAYNRNCFVRTSQQRSSNTQLHARLLELQLTAVCSVLHTYFFLMPVVSGLFDSCSI